MFDDSYLKGSIGSSSYIVLILLIQPIRIVKVQYGLSSGPAPNPITAIKPTVPVCALEKFRHQRFNKSFQIDTVRFDLQAGSADNRPHIMLGCTNLLTKMC